MTMNQERFRTLTDHRPFPWQCKLYDQFVADPPGSIPAVASIPTGLGKTSVIVVWLLAWLANPDRLPRRLVYVVIYREIDGVWQESVRFSAEDTQGGDQFGIRVDIAGNRGLVGAFFDDDNGSASGAAFVFALGRDCPADLTGPGGDGEPDGSLTADDFFFYLRLFADGCP